MLDFRTQFVNTKDGQYGELPAPLILYTRSASRDDIESDSPRFVPIHGELHSKIIQNGITLYVELPKRLYIKVHEDGGRFPFSAETNHDSRCDKDNVATLNTTSTNDHGNRCHEPPLVTKNSIDDESSYDCTNVDLHEDSESGIDNDELLNGKSLIKTYDNDLSEDTDEYTVIKNPKRTCVSKVKSDQCITDNSKHAAELSSTNTIDESYDKSYKDPTTKSQHACLACYNLTFERKSDLRAHVRTFHETVDGYKCMRCTKTKKPLTTLKSFQAHISSVHSLTRPHVCEICGKSFKKISGVKNHRITHTTDRPFSCDVCQQTFAQTSTLHAHVKAVHEKDKPHVCEVCGKAFIWLNRLQIHSRKHTGLKPYRCIQCNKSFSRRAGLRIHKRIHTGERPYECRVCHRNFVQLSALLVHGRTHTGERPFSCKICSKNYKSMAGLQSHERSQHTGERPFSCNLCHKSFIDRCGLKSHLIMHSGTKSHVCEICGKCFADSGKLSSHKKTHSDNRPFICDSCPAMFKEKRSLKTHNLRVHSTVKAYMCDICDRRFADNSSLSQHKTRNHSGRTVKPRPRRNKFIDDGGRIDKNKEDSSEVKFDSDQDKKKVNMDMSRSEYQSWLLQQHPGLNIDGYWL